MKNDSQIIQKKPKNGFKVFLGVCLVISIYLMLRISYVLNYDDLRNNDFFNMLFKRIINPLPFELTFNYYSMFVSMFWLLIYAMVIKEKAKPKADSKWMDKEHGSNDFYSKEEVEDFISKKTDSIISFNENDLQNVENYIKNN